MYKTIVERFGIFTKVKLINEESGDSVAVVPEYGGNLVELILGVGDDQYSIIDGCNNYKELLEDDRYKSAELSPFPGRINNGAFNFQNKSYQVAINEPDSGHALHGFIYNKKFELVEHKALKDEATLLIKYKYSGDIEGFPFPFEIVKSYSLGERDLFCNTAIRNTGTGKLPIGHGWHPFFRLGRKINKLMLKLPKGQAYETNENLIPSGKSVLNRHFLDLSIIGDAHFNTSFKILEKSDRCFTVLHDPDQQITLKVWQDIDKNRYQYLHVYTPPSRTSIGLQPMTCIPDALNNEEGLIILAKGEEIEMSYGVMLEEGAY